MNFVYIKDTRHNVCGKLNRSVPTSNPLSKMELEQIFNEKNFMWMMYTTFLVLAILCFFNKAWIASLISSVCAIICQAHIINLNTENKPTK